MNWYTVRRLAVLASVLAFACFLPLAVKPISDLIGIEDGFQFFVGSILFVTAWRSSVRFFTDHPLKFARLLSLAVSFWSASFMVSAVWAVRWRASDYSPYFSDDTLRYAFRFLALCGSVCAVAAPEFFEQELSSERLRKLGLVFVLIAATVLLLIYGSRLERTFLHDVSPTPATVEGKP